MFLVGLGEGGADSRGALCVCGDTHLHFPYLHHGT